MVGVGVVAVSPKKNGSHEHDEEKQDWIYAAAGGAVFWRRDNDPSSRFAAELCVVYCCVRCAI